MGIAPATDSPLRTVDRDNTLLSPSEKVRLDVIDDLTGKQPIDEIQSQFFKEYPAHMHIDMISDAQGLGLGEQMILKLFAKLKEPVDGVSTSGVHLVCGEENMRARQLY